MEITLIRHGKTDGNVKKLFVGLTDNELIEEGIQELIKYKEMNIYPKTDILYTSPLKRCISTCKIIYPDIKYNVENGLIEMNFGKFEAMSYEQISSIPEYANFWTYENKMTFPDGDNIKTFKERCITTFDNVVKKGKSSVLVCHGGTIMAILERYGIPKNGFYSWFTENGLGYVLKFEGRNIKMVERLKI